MRERIVMNPRHELAWLFAAAILGLVDRPAFGEDSQPVAFVKPTPNRADEPLTSAALGKTMWLS